VHNQQSTVVLLSAFLLLISCTKPMTMQMRVAAYEAEIRTATIEEKNVPIVLGVYPGTLLPSLLPNLIPDTTEGLVYWEWAEVAGDGVRKTVQTAYARLRPTGVEFPFARELDFSKIYMGIGIHLTFLYKNSAGEWVQRLVLPGMLSKNAKLEPFKLKQRGALRYEDANLQLVDVERIPPTQRAAFIAQAFEMILVP